MITLELDTYLKLLEKANRSPLLNAQFTLVTRDQATAIRSDLTWEHLVSLQPLDSDEIGQLRSLGLVSNDVKDGDYLKLYRIGDWLTLTLLDAKRKEDLRAQTIELSARLNRVNNAISEIVKVLSIDHKTATTVLKDCVLKGLMPDLAKILNLEDLVNKPIPERIN